MIKMAFDNSGPETEEDIMRIAKKGGYTAVKVDENKVWVTYDLVKNRVGAPSKRTPGIKEKIIEMRVQGKTIKAISQELGVGRSSVYNYLNDKEK